MTQQLIPKQKKMSNIIITGILVALIHVLIIICMCYVRRVEILKIGIEALIMQMEELTEENKQLKSQIQSVPKWEGKSIIPNETTK